MEKLIDLAKVLRTKNAGPLQLTFDVMFDNAARYERVKASGTISPETVAELYGVAAKDVDVIFYDIVTSLKVTIPRLVISGALGDTDVYGCQQQYNLGQLLIP